jgi:MFS family permease
MYVAESTRAILQADAPARGVRGRLKGVSQTVVLLGATSFFTDVSAEMVSTILPIYIVFALGGSPLQLGVIDGIYQGAAAFVRILAGAAADRNGRHKLIASVGYGLSAVCKLGFVAAGGAAGALVSVLLLDRTGKGIRTAPRDALISMSTRPEALGLAFGVHRAMDTAGAFLGPLVAVGLLLLAPGDYDAVFLVSFLVALLGVATLVLLVPSDGPARARKGCSDGAPAALLREPRFRTLVLASGALALVTISDAFLYLGLQRRMDFSPPLLPLLYVGTALAFMLLAVPVGRLADRIGRGKVFVGGYVLLGITYTSLLLPSIGWLALALYLFLLGSFYAATDGVLAAMGSAVLPAELRATGLSLLSAADSVMTLVSSIAFGALWTLTSLGTALVVFAVALAATVLVAGVALLARRAPAAADAA